MNETHEKNRKYWDRASDNWRRLRDEDGLLSRLKKEPDLAFDGGLLDEIRNSTGDLYGKDVCVVGSGDNYAAFALAGLGTRVVSTDISQEQLDTAATRSKELGLDIEFSRADAATLCGISDISFDLVVSSNGFFVWISDLDAVFSSIYRILRPGGHYMFYDIHPFNRPWGESGNPLAMEKPYWATGPHIGDDGTVVNFHWVISDLLNSMTSAGLTLVRLRESRSTHTRMGRSYKDMEPNDDQADWRKDALAGLPTWLTVNSQRRVVLDREFRGA